MRDRLEPSVEAVVALGANLGDRAATIRSALNLIQACPETNVDRCSSLIETLPEGMGADAKPFLNGVALVNTQLSITAFFNHINAIEIQLGRQSKGAYENRTIDIDIIFWGDHVINTPTLQVPHPRYQTRSFVCVPLLEIDPNRRDPVSGRPVRDLVGAT